MDNNKIQLIGAPCGYHGPYTFYKAFKYNKNGRHKILALSDFFFVKLWSDSDLMSIGELQLLWMDKNSEQVLASLRLYFLPENTPEGRNDDHGEDEVLAISEKVVLRVEDLLDWITEEAGWTRGLAAVWEKDCQNSGPPVSTEPSALLVDSVLDFQDILKEKQQLDTEEHPVEAAVVVLSFPRYCRYRGIMKRLEGVSNKWLRNALVMALGGFAVPCRNTRILFCKDTFDYPDLEGHEVLCNHLAPNLKGRPRRKRKKRSLSPGGSESNESESSLSTVSSSIKSKQPGSKNGLRCNLVQLRKSNHLSQTRRSSRITVSAEEKEFLVKLHSFMKTRRTPIARVPHLGFKEIDLYAFFSKVQKMGGYNSVTANRMWKPIYDELGGDQGSTSAATYTRRHYERLLLPYERSVRGEQAKSGYRNHMKLKSGKMEERKQVARKTSVAASTAETTTENKVQVECGTQREKAAENKPSSLRSIRTKADKSQELLNAARPQNKENIPLSNVSEGIIDIKSESACESSVETKPIPELIDLASDESPVKIGKTPVPALKKRKLDILKEGGLEVTAITSIGAETSIGATVERRPSVIQHAAPIQQMDSQVSITVTPDVGHIIGSPPTDPASTPSPVSPYEVSIPQHTVINVQDLKHNMYIGSGQAVISPVSSRSDSVADWSPPRVVQSRSIYAHSENTVYGNPKDDFESPRLLFHRGTVRPPVTMSGEEVLDLRVKCVQKPVVTVSRVASTLGPHGTSKNPIRTLPKNTSHTAFPMIGGRTLVGSNLEITVVDVPKPTQQRHHQQLQQQQRHSQQQRRSSSGKVMSNRIPSRNENGKYSSSTLNHQSVQRNNSLGGNAQLVIPNPYLSSSTNGRNNASDSSRARLQQNQTTLPTAPPNNVVPFLPGGSSLFPNYLPQTTSGGGGSKSGTPYMPMLDPIYYSSLYGSHGLYPPSLGPGFVSPMQAPPMFAPATDHLQLYKELMSRHGFLGLPRDGSTSITPVGHSPSSSSK